MAPAIDETNRRRAKQVAYNTEHGIDPQPLRKKIADITDMLAREDADTTTLMAAAQGRGPSRRKSPVPDLGELGDRERGPRTLPAAELADLVTEPTEQMHSAAAELQFEVAARLRDEVAELKKELRAMLEATK